MTWNASRSGFLRLTGFHPARSDHQDRLSPIACMSEDHRHRVKSNSPRDELPALPCHRPDQLHTGTSTILDRRFKRTCLKWSIASVSISGLTSRYRRAEDYASPGHVPRSPMAPRRPVPRRIAPACRAPGPRNQNDRRRTACLSGDRRRGTRGRFPPTMVPSCPLLPPRRKGRGISPHELSPIPHPPHPVPPDSRMRRDRLDSYHSKRSDVRGSPFERSGTRKRDAVRSRSCAHTETREKP